MLLLIGPSVERKPTIDAAVLRPAHESADGDLPQPLIEAVVEAVGEQRQPIADVPAEVVIDEAQGRSQNCRGRVAERASRSMSSTIQSMIRCWPGRPRLVCQRWLMPRRNADQVVGDFRRRGRPCLAGCCGGQRTARRTASARTCPTGWPNVRTAICRRRELGRVVVERIVERKLAQVLAGVGVEELRLRT